MIPVAIVEYDPATVDRLFLAIRAAQDIEIVAVARNAKSGLQLIEAGEFEVLLCDLALPDGSGITLIREMSRRHPDPDTIVITIFADQAKVLDSIKAGARGYLLKDERLEDCVDGIREIRRGGSPIRPIIGRQFCSSSSRRQGRRQGGRAAAGGRAVAARGRGAQSAGAGLPLFRDRRANDAFSTDCWNACETHIS